MTPDARLGFAREAAVAFRLGMDAQGGVAFARLIDLLSQSLSAPGSPALLMRLQPILMGMLQAQSRGDMLHLADMLEFQLAPLLAPASTK